MGILSESRPINCRRCGGIAYIVITTSDYDVWAKGSRGAYVSSNSRLDEYCRDEFENGCKCEKPLVNAQDVFEALSYTRVGQAFPEFESILDSDAELCQGWAEGTAIGLPPLSKAVIEAAQFAFSPEGHKKGSGAMRDLRTAVRAYNEVYVIPTMVMFERDQMSGKLIWGQGHVKSRFNNVSDEARERTGCRSMIIQPDEADKFDVVDGCLVYGDTEAKASEFTKSE